MRGKLLLLTVLFLLFLGFVIFRFFVLGASNVVGQIKINSSPEASVFLDAVAEGKTPYEGKLKDGVHELKLIPLGEATNTASFSQKITITKNTLTYINTELGSSELTTAAEIITIGKTPKKTAANEGEIEVESDPAGAITSLDNDEKGTATLVLTNVAKGNHEVSVSLPGFFPRTERINVEPGYRTRVFFKLAVDQGQQKKVADVKKKQNEQNKPTPGVASKKKVIIQETPTGFLRVRESPSISAAEVAQVKPGTEFEVRDEQAGWYQIEYQKGKLGWVSSEYATLGGPTAAPSPTEEATGSAR